MEKYKIPYFLNVEVKTTYKGEHIDQEFLDSNPDIYALYPLRNNVLKAYLELKQKAHPNKVSVLQVTEKGIIEHLDIREW